jgi:hypothetical protein
MSEGVDVAVELDRELHEFLAKAAASRPSFVVMMLWCAATVHSCSMMTRTLFHGHLLGIQLLLPQ